MSKKEREPNNKLSKLVSQVKDLSKSVDELEKEIADLKLKICRNKDKKPTAPPKESKNDVNAAAKSSPFRLKFFRKTGKTKENGAQDDSSKKTETKKKDDSTRDAIPSNTPPSDHKPSSRKNYTDESNEVQVKSKRKNDFTQTSNRAIQIISPSTQKQEQADYSKSDTCCCKSGGNKSNNGKSKTDKDKIKSKRKMCSDDCPYLPKDSYYNNVESTSRKPFKNKKLMVNLIGSNRAFKDQMQRNKNFVLDCKFLQNADFGKLTDPKDEKRRRKIKLFSCGESRSSKKDCKHCSKNCKTKNVLKIKKAILTQEPPMIFMSPDLERSKIRCKKKKQRRKCKNLEDAEICCEDSSEDGSAENSDSFECPCSSFAASINARYNAKLCQTEIPRK